ncbi:MAG TPA: FtsX-like permease family protein [Streptosporangiaceae bacterium]
MTATGMILRAGWRGRWRAWVALALLIGAFAGAVTAVAAGARRTDAAYPRLVRWSRTPDVLLFSSSGHKSRTFASLQPGQLIGLPQVAEGAAMTGYTVASPADYDLIAPRDQQVPGVMWHRKLLAGRLPRPGRADEADVSFTGAQRHHLAVGDWIRLALSTQDGPPVTVRLHVVGIDAAPSEFPPQFGSGVDIVWATPAFWRMHRQQPLVMFIGAALRLRAGTGGVTAVQHAASRLAHGRLTLAFPIASQSINTQRSIHLQAVALWLLAALLAITGLLIARQLLARLVAAESGPNDSLRALGLTRTQLLAAGLGRAGLIGAVAGGSAVVLGVALSPLFPVGLAGVAEPYPGLDADFPALTAGALGTLLLVVVAAAGPTWRSTGRRAGPSLALAGDRPSGVTRVTAGLRPVSGAVGVRLALQRGAGRTALPVSSTLAGAALGIAALTAALVFAASLTYLAATPRLYGTTWNASVSSLSNLSGVGVSGAVRTISSDMDVSAFSEGYAGVPLLINGTQADGIAMKAVRGQPITTPLLAGRLPASSGEIVLGAQSMRSAGTALGGTVRVSLGNGPVARLRVVGVAVFPSLDDTLTLGKGAGLTIGALGRLVPRSAQLPPFDHVFLRFRPGAGAAAYGTLARRVTTAGPFAMDGPPSPAEVINFGQVQNLPLILGGSFGVLALLTITHLLITSVRRRRRDIAVLRAVGFSRRQVRAAVAWQSATLMTVSLAVGVPAGLIAGRQIWLLLTRQLGVLPAVAMPAVTLALLVVAAVPVAIAIAAWPGEAAARISPALALRAE